MQISLTFQYLSLLCGNYIFKITTLTAITTEEYSYRAYHEIKKICKEHKIIPDVIGGAPEHKIEIAYNKDTYIDFGTYLTIDQIKEEPTLIRWPALTGLLYTLMLISPDYPTRENPEGKEWQYWLVSNIHGGDLKLAQTMTEYSPPKEIHGKEPHRMVFLAFMQRTTRLINFTEPHFTKEVICEERANFEAREFADKYNFPELTAMNFFLIKPTNNT